MEQEKEVTRKGYQHPKKFWIVEKNDINWLVRTRCFYPIKEPWTNDKYATPETSSS